MDLQNIFMFLILQRSCKQGFYSLSMITSFFLLALSALEMSDFTKIDLLLGKITRYPFLFTCRPAAAREKNTQFQPVCFAIME